MAQASRANNDKAEELYLYVRYSIFHVLSIASWLFGCCEPQELVVDVLMPRIAPASCCATLGRIP